MENPIFNSNIAAAVVGVIGTLLGTCLGWVLNEFSQRGKLHLFVKSWIDNFDAVGGKSNCSSNKSEIFRYKYEGTIEIYNSSSVAKIMRNIEVSFNDNENTNLFESVPFDHALDIQSQFGSRGVRIKPINIPPKTVVLLSIYDYIEIAERGSDCFWETQIINLRYTDEDNKNRTCLIRNRDYSEILEECVSETHRYR